MTEAKNIVYKTKHIESYFSKNRISWEHFYESEKEIIDGLNLDKNFLRF